MATTNKNTEDLLATIKRNKKIAGEDTMQASDFFQAPNFEGADVTDNQHLNVGNASYETLGSQPIFVGRGGLTPRSSKATRQGSIDSAALKAKLYNAAVEEKKKDAADKGLEGLNKLKADDKEVPMQYNMDYQSEGLDIVQKYRKAAESDPSFNGPTDALNDLSNNNGKYGGPMMRDLLAHKVYGENLNQAAKVSTEIEKNLAEGNFVPDGIREANRKFNAGEMKGQSAPQIALDMTAMSAMKNLMPELNDFSSSFDATKTASGFHYVNDKNVEPEARGFVRAKVDGGLKPVLTRALGLADNATEDEMTAALTRQVVKKHATQQDKPDEPTAAEKNSQWKKEGNSLYNGENVWQYNVDDNGNETFTFAKKNPADNSPMTFRGIDGTPVKGVSGRIEKAKDEKGQHLFVATTDEVGDPVEVEVLADVANIDKIKAEYGKNIFEVRDAITGTLEVGKGKTGTLKESGVKSTSKSSGSSMVHSATKAEWMKAGWTEDQIKKAQEQHLIEVR